MKNRIRIRSAIAIAAAIFASSSRSLADTLYWNTPSSGLWSDTANWWTTAGGTTNPAAAPGSADTVFFNGTGVDGATLVQLDAATSVGGMTFVNTDTTLLQSDSATSRMLTLGAGGITINAGAGAVTLGDVTNGMPVAINASQSWTNNSSNTFTVLNGISTSVAGTQTLTLGGSGNSTFSGVLSNGTGVLALAKTGAGTLILTGANTYTGNTAVSGGTLQLGNGTTNSAIVGNYSVASGALLRFRYNATGVTGAPTFSNVTGAGTLALATGKNFDFGWGVPALTAGFTGTFQIEGGRISPAAPGNFGNAANITILNGGHLGLYNFGNNTLSQNLTIAGTGYGEGGYESAIRMGNAGQSTTLSGSVALSASATLAASGTGTISGVISGAAGSNLTFGTSLQTGTVILTNANTYAGATTIAFGTLQLGNGGTTGSLSTSGAITNNGTLAINRSNAVAQGVDFSGAAITGTGGFTQAGSGTTTLTAANTFSGNTTVSAGSLNLSNSLALQNSTVTIGGTGIVFDSSVGSHAFTLGGLAGSTSLALADNAGSPNAVALTVGTNNSSNVYSGALSGTGSLTKVGTGIQTLSGVNTYAGGTTLSAGTLQFGKLTSTPGTGTIAVGTGTTLAVNVGGAGEWTTGTSGVGTLGGLLAGLGGQGSSVTYTGTVALGFDTTNAPSTQTYSGNIANVGTTLGITKLGTNTLALTGANTYTGATNVNGGTLSIGGSGTLNGGTYAGNLTIASGATFDYASSASQTLSGTNSGAGALAVSGTGTLTLTNASTAAGAFLPVSYTGGTTITGGTLKIDLTARSNDTGFSLGTINVASGGTLELFTSKTVAFGTQDALISNGTVITGSGTINKTGSGVADLWYSGTGTSPSIKNFTGQINIQAGVLSNQTGADWSTSAGLMSVDISSGAFFDLRTDSAVINKLTGSGTVANSHNLSLNLTVGGGNGSGTFSGLIRNGGAFPGGANTGPISLTKTGTGTQTFNGTTSFTYNGATTIRGGTLALDFANMATPTNLLAPASALTLGGGTLSILGKSTGTTAQTLASLSLTAGTTSSIVLNPNGGTSTTLTITSNTVTTGAGAVVNFNYSAGTTSGTTVGNNIVAWNPTLTGGIIGSAYTVTDVGGTGYATVVAGKVVRLADTGTSGLPVSGGVSTTNYFVNQSYSTSSTTTDGSLVEALSGAVVANGVTVDTTGLASGANLALGANTLTLTTGMTFSGANPYAITATSGGGLQGTAGGSVTFNNFASSPVTISAPILANGANALTFTGTGTTVLSGSNTYTGGTTIAGGTVSVGSATALGTNASAVTVRSGAALDLNGTTMTGTNALTLNGTGVGGGGALTNGIATAGTYAGLVTLGSNSSIVASNGNIILSNTGTITGSGFGLTLGGAATGSSIASIIGTGAGTLTKEGTGTWTLTRANTYTGATNVNTGTLTVGTGGSLANTSSITIASGATLNLSGSASNQLAVNSVNGALTINGRLDATTNQANTLSHIAGYFTTFSMNNGTLASTFAGGNTSGFGAFFFNASRTITATGTNAISGLGVIGISSGNVLTLNTPGAADVINVDGTIGQGGSGTAGGLAKTGAGTVVLSGVNTYTGGTTVNAGTLKYDLSTRTTNPINLGANFVAAGATLELFRSTTGNVDAGGTAFAGPTAFTGAGTIIKSGAGYLDMWNNGSATSIKNFTGLVDVQAGALASNGSDWNTSAGLMDLNVNTGATFDIRTGGIVIDQLTGDGIVGSSHSVAVSLTLGSANGSATFGGTIRNGTSLAGGANTGAISLTKNGTGTQSLTGANTYSGTTTVNSGTLNLSNTAGYKSTSLAVASGATLVINATGNATSAGANSVGSWAPFNSVVASVTGAGVVALNGTQFVNGSVSSGGFRTNLSAGGVIDVQGGSWAWGFNRGVAATNLGSLNITSGAEWRSSDPAFQFDALTGAGTIAPSFSTAVTLTVGVSNTQNNATYGVAGNTATFSGSIKNGDAYTGVTTGALSLVKTGAGTQILSGASTYTGGTTISGGTLLANNITGSATGTGAVAVDSGGKLGGSGTVGAVNVNNGGTIAPGNSVGTLTTGAEVWADGGTYIWELVTNVAGDGSAAGTGWDLLELGTSNLNVTADGTTKFTVQITRTGAGLNPINPDDWFTIAHAGSLTSFSTADFLLPDLAGGEEWEIRQIAAGGGGFNVQLSTVPEPSSLGIALLGLGAGLLRRRRGR